MARIAKPISSLPAQPNLSRRQALHTALGGLLGSCMAGQSFSNQIDNVNDTAPSLTMPDAAIWTSAPAFSLPNSRQIDLQAGDRRWRIFVSQPAHAAPKSGYPVLYTLDGNALFGLFAALARQQAERPDHTAANTPVIVGIGYPIDAAYDMQARERDYTLAPLTAEPGPNSADLFLDFIQHTLQPWLAQQIPLDTQRQGLFGHSFGGLLSLYTLLTRTSMFQHYIAASPSIWWGQRAVLPFRDRFIAQSRGQAPLSTQLLITAGSLEENTPQLDPERQRRQQQRRIVSTARDMALSLKEVPGLRTGFKLLDGEDHGSVTLRSASLALHGMNQIRPVTS
ncbi:alpha/beta hydrolase-fold protein [Chitinivorax sp. B]|uniref:alpha/beta hydrolase n=1 Tax=Chitinivorax sp. B TaxID=2502235 RepID=UPI0020170B6B|nr:alpha/beta hydrolase-fold protein [Chitinivorax sp. B]